MTLLYPAATERLVPYDTGHAIASIGLVLHVQAGDNSPYGWFANPANQAVSHWWISKTGDVEQYVSADRKSWAQAAGNDSYHSVETEGQPTEALTAAQVTALTALYAWGHTAFGWALQNAERPGQPGFGWHGMGAAAWGGHYGCPGDLRKAQRAAVLDGVRKPRSLEDTMFEVIQRPDGARYAINPGGGAYWRVPNDAWLGVLLSSPACAGPVRLVDQAEHDALRAIALSAQGK